MINLLFLILLCATNTTMHAIRASSEPYISGDTFRSIANILFDETTNSMDPACVKTNDIIFVKTDYIERFFREYHPQIATRYILVTHNSDCKAPSNCAQFLDDDKLIAWFAQNVEDYNHPKLISIPIGIANRCWDHGNIALFSRAIQKNSAKLRRKNLLYMNISVGTFPTERGLVYNLFQDAPYCVKSPIKSVALYLQDLARSKFVLSPRGNGIDCHRTWEALLMGAIPIVRTSSLDPMYEGLPVLIINDWHEVTEGFLKAKYKEFKNTPWNKEKVYAHYWLNLIKAKQIAL